MLASISGTEVEIVIMLLLASAIAAAGVVGTVLTVNRDGYRRIPTELRF